MKKDVCVNLTYSLIKEYVEIEGLSMKYYKNLMGTYTVEMSHKSREVILDINDWFLDCFPSTWNILNYGNNEGGKSHWLKINVDRLK